MKEQILDEFSIKINGNVEKIPLSNGINAVIGGNTSGKSLLISKAFGKLDARKKYLSFLEKWKIDFLDAGVASDKLEFIFQGQIRKAFEEDGASLVSKFQNRFKQIQYKDFVDKLDVAKDVLFSIAEMNTRREENSKKADCIISIPNYEDKTFYPQITPNPLKPANPSRVIVNKIEKIVFLISELIEVCENEDKPELRKTKDLFLAFLKHYEEKNASELFSQEIFETFIRGVSEYKNHVEKMGLTVSEKELLQYDEITQRYLKDVSEFIVLKFTPRKKIEDQVSSFQIDPVIENYNGLQFVTTPKVFLYDKKIILDILFSPFKLGSFDYLNPELIVNVTLEDFYEAIKNNSKEKINNLNFKQRYDTLFHEEINQNYCADTFKILDLGEEVQNTKSPGNNAVYFIRAQADFLNNKLIVIDQPEDDVAPEKIKDELIRSLDKMAITNQIIIVTHNPQLVVNLDVDNVICLDTSKDKFDVFYGPLYEKSRCNMLKIIADKLEGGKKLLKERWKRYEERDSSDKE